MICIFMVIYVIAQMIINPPGGLWAFVKTCLRFAVYSLLAGGLAAVVRTRSLRRSGRRSGGRESQAG